MQYCDQALLLRMKDDDESAYRAIYLKYAEKLFAYAFNILRQRETCEDILQNVFIHLWENRNRSKIVNLKAYLYKAVKFQVIHLLRTKKYTQEDITRLNILDATLDVSKQMELDELDCLIRNLVANLSTRCRQIFIMSRFEEKSNKEIAKELGLSLQSVKNQITIAKRKLQEQISAEQFVLYNILGLFTFGICFL